MPDPISSTVLNQAAKTTATPDVAAPPETAKQGPSKFDQVRQSQQVQGVPAVATVHCSPTDP